MLEFTLPDMTCGHCVQAVQQAVHEADPQARVEVDLPTQQVRIETAQPREAVVARLVEAGYQPA
jgi:copper chaperone